MRNVFPLYIEFRATLGYAEDNWDRNRRRDTNCDCDWWMHFSLQDAPGVLGVTSFSVVESGWVIRVK